jgi:uncharacterized protein (DUF1015 family)
MRILAFQGTRYADRHENPGSFAAPPYDQISDALRDRLHQDPLSFSHLLRPAPAPDTNPHQQAAHLHRRWLEDGVVERDTEASLYPYAIHLPDGGRRLGLATLVEIESPDSGIIRPHERTVEKTVEERLQLLRAMRTDIGPVLLLSEDGGGLDDLLNEDVARLPALAEHQDPDGNRHLLYRLDDEFRIASYRKALKSCAGLIADGHHRYKVSRLYAAEIDAERGTAGAAKLAVITSLDSPGLTIDPIHRALRAPVGLDSPQVAVVDRSVWNGTSGADFAAAVAAAPQPAVGVVAIGQAPQIWRLDPATGPEELPAAASHLTVVLLHHCIFPVWNIHADNAVDGTVLYRSDPDDLWKSTLDGSVATGFFLPPMSTGGFAGAIANGDVLPPKSTRFLPKLVSGLVWSGHDTGVA